MGGLGSGRRKRAESDADIARLDAARLELGREVARANRCGDSVCRCRREALQEVLRGTIAVMAENAALRHDLSRALARESAYLNDDHRDRDGGSAGDAAGGSTAKQRQPGPCEDTASPN